ncbi:MAG: hypothetical protein WCD34_20595 [Candidatus Acidiferrum sp.]
MLEPSQTAAAGNIEVALQTLRTLNIAFRGPFITPKKHRIYLVDGCILTESEIVVLHEGGKLTSENISKFLSELRVFQTQESSDELRSASELDPLKRRRSQRVMLRLDVLVRFEIREGSPLQTHAFTVAVNAHGGLMESPFRMIAGQRITLINPQSGKEVGCRVVKVHRSSEGYFATAFEFEQHSPQFWAIAFPPLDWGMTEEPA